MTPNIRRALRPLALAIAVFSVGAFAALAADAAPIITTQPQDQTIAAGSAATLTVEATGTGTLTYQWYVGESGDISLPFTGATSDTLETPNLYVSANYWVRVTDDSGSSDSLSATVIAKYGDGTGESVMWGLGSREFGGMGDGYGDQPALTPIQVATDAVAVSAGAQHALILKDDGTLWGFGGNVSKQLGKNVPVYQRDPILLASDVAQATAGRESTYFVKTDGTLWGTGGNHPDGPVEIASGVTACAAGALHVLVLREDGSLWAKGWNGHGQLGDGTTVDKSELIKVAESVSAIAAGYFHSLFVTDSNTLWAMGANSDGQLGDGTTADRHDPIQVATGVDQATAGQYHSVFKKTDGSLWTMGSNDAGQLGDGTIIQRESPTVVGFDVATIASGAWHTLFTKVDGTLWGMGRNHFGALGVGTTVGTTVAVEIAPDVIAIAAGDSFSHFLTSDGSAWAMGNNLVGQLGNGAMGFHGTPTAVGLDIGMAATDRYHSLFLKADGTLWAVGDDSYDNKATVTRTSRPDPLLVAEDVASVATNELHTAFVKRDGSLWTFGTNDFGQLGDGTNSGHSEPVKITDSVAAVAAGPVHTAFVKLNGSLWTVGGNLSGQLGNGGTGNVNSPVEIAADVAAVATGGRHTVFVKDDGTVWATGDNSLGQFGDGTESSSVVPVQVGDGAAAVAVGEFHTMVLGTDGELIAAGLNDQAQLGDNSTIDRSAFVSVATGVSAVAAADRHTLFLKENGTLWAVGANYAGQVGFDSSFPNYRQTPVQIAYNVFGIVAGDARSFFVQEVHLPVFTLQPAAQIVKNNVSIALSVQISSEAPVEYQWYQGESGDVSTPIEDETSPFFSSPVLTETTSYWVRASNVVGHTDSATALITVVHPPVIEAQPESGTIVGPATVDLAVGATSEVAPDYQWYRGESGDTSQPIDGATSATYTTPILSDDVSYWIRVSNLAGATDSATANVTVILPPVITAQPVSQTVNSGTEVELMVAVADSRLIEYQWYLGESGDDLQPVEGASGASLAISGITNHAAYWVRVSSIAGTVDSDTAMITVAGPLITAQPVSVAKTSGGAVTLSIVSSASDDSDVSYQWYFNGEAIEGATSDTFTLPSAQTFHAGDYHVVVSALGISVASGSASLTVNTPPPSDARLMNLSTRALASTGSDVLIPGFVIGGTGTKKLLIRAVGPRLGEDPFFVPDVLPDPRLVLKRWNGTTYVDVASNDNWGANANLTDIVQASAEVYAFGLEDGSADAVLLVDLPAGQYTAVADDVNGATGVAVVELYDTDETDASAKLVNISTRGFVGSGAEIMIPGLVISSEGPKTLLIRAVGPALAQDPFNLSGVLEDSRLTVYRKQEPILSNDDWSADATMAAQTAAVAQQVYAFPLAAGSKDAAFVVTLAPGIYTVHATGKDGATGTALVEVYEVP